MEKFRRCQCTQFESNDTSEDPPRDHEKLLYYVSHGLVQPLEGHLKQDGRYFRIEWYTRFKWLKYSVRMQKSFCFFCRIFKTSTTTLHGGHADKIFQKLVSATGKKL